ncbi:adipokinetic hormone/corazonin-related peptide receptor variant I [Aedes albopictus]|uniref:G-protein coupled receptors family 1 profile domain-containing protein n=1 Tax=Aedes albopictus TaxID=7160 RepID=A0ABM1ZQH2_AEDAL
MYLSAGLQKIMDNSHVTAKHQHRSQDEMLPAELAQQTTSGSPAMMLSGDAGPFGSSSSGAEGVFYRGLGTLTGNASGMSSGMDMSNSTETGIVAPGHTETTVAVIIVYCVLFIIAAGGNLSVVITLFRSRRHRRSRVSLMICHLAVADLMVAFIMIPLEVGWRITVQWHAGNVACKVFLFMRAFCLYLSSNVLVCVSLDRCFAVIYPLRVSAARKRGKIMLGGAWFIAFANAIPQSIIFRVQHHPNVPDFTQCVTFGFFTTPAMETAYNLFCVVAMYFMPLMVISAAYTVILCEISNRSREKAIGELHSPFEQHHFKYNDLVECFPTLNKSTFLEGRPPSASLYKRSQFACDFPPSPYPHTIEVISISHLCSFYPFSFIIAFPEGGTAGTSVATTRFGNCTTTVGGRNVTEPIRTVTMSNNGNRMKGFQPSYSEFVVLADERSLMLSRPSFYSDPTPNEFDSTVDCGLTRSLDTGGWR